MCGHGHFDMAAWEKYSKGEIDDFEFSQEVRPTNTSPLPTHFLIQTQSVLVRNRPWMKRSRAFLA